MNEERIPTKALRQQLHTATTIDFTRAIIESPMMIEYVARGVTQKNPHATVDELAEAICRTADNMARASIHLSEKEFPCDSH